MLGFVYGAGASPVLRSGIAPPPLLLVPQTSAVAVPRQQLPGVNAAGASAAAPAAGEAAGLGAATLAQHVVAIAAVWGILAAWRRRSQRGGRVALGPRGGNFYEYKFRAKPGDKFKYRYSTDVHTPEFGVWPPEAEHRLIKWGELLEKGTPQGPAEFLMKREGEQFAKMGPAAGLCGTLLLDCDGTLVETERDGHRVAFNQAFKEKSFTCEWGVDLYGELLTTGGGKERMTRYFTDYNPEAWPHEDPPAKDHPAIVELHELKTKLFMEIVRSGALPLREGIAELLSAADKAGWQLGVCSTSNEDSVRAVVETMLPRYANSMRIFAGDIVSKKKPDPEIYLLAAKKMGVAPMKCVVVEDASIGCRAAKAAGMQVIVTKSIYTEDEDFGDADLVVAGAQELDFEGSVVPLLPALQMI